MKLYNYSGLSGEFLYESDARESPLEPGTFLIPAFATTKPPISVGDKQVAAFLNGEWVAVEDHRGETWYAPDGAPITIGFIGKPAVFGLLEVAPPPPPTPPPENGVPSIVSPYQARIALLNAGLLERVEALMSDPSTPQAAKIAWEYATEWDRSSDFISSLGPSLGLTDADIDNLFIAASKVT